MGKLTAVVAARINKLGLTPDGDGLYLQVSSLKAGGLSRSWVVRYSGADGRRREAGLGRFPDVGVAAARKRAKEIRAAATIGRDPLQERDVARAEAEAEAAKLVTFKECAERYVEAHEATWTNAKHAWQWTNTLRRLAYPVIGKVPVQEVDGALVLKVLDPIWRKTPETANRLRGRIELVLAWAKARGLREGENPAAWRGNLQHALPAPTKVRPRSHHTALPYDEVPAFVRSLEDIEQASAKALVFTIFTAARTSETLGALWDEIDMNAALWTVPAERMKGRRAHRVPLSPGAMKVLHDVGRLARGQFVFTGPRSGGQLSNMAMLMLLRRMGRADLTAHGFRSSFRDWCADKTEFPREVAEAALAHVVGDKVEAAYLRSDMFEKRRALMAAWSEFVLDLG